MLFGGRVQHVRPLRKRRGLLALDVGDTEPTAHDELGKPAVLHERRQHLDRGAERIDREHLAADVGVEPDEIDRR